MSNITNLDTRIKSMTEYLREFIPWLTTDEAKEVPGDLFTKVAAFKEVAGLPVGWVGPVDRTETATMNFFNSEGGDRFQRLKALFEDAKESDDYAAFDAAVADAVRDELGVKDEEQEEDVAQLPDEDAAVR